MPDGFETAPARSHTFAVPGTTPERFRFPWSSCQHWEQSDIGAENHRRHPRRDPDRLTGRPAGTIRLPALLRDVIEHPLE